MTCPGVALDLELASEGISGFACGYAGTGFVLAQWSRTDKVPGPTILTIFGHLTPDAFRDAIA